MVGQELFGRRSGREALGNRRLASVAAYIVIIVALLSGLLVQSAFAPAHAAQILAQAGETSSPDRSRLDWPSAWQPEVNGQGQATKRLDIPTVGTSDGGIADKPLAQGSPPPASDVTLSPPGVQSPAAASPGAEPVKPEPSDAPFGLAPSPLGTVSPVGQTNGTEPSTATPNGAADAASPAVPAAQDGDVKNGATSSETAKPRGANGGTEAENRPEVAPSVVIPGGLKAELAPVSALEERMDAVAKTVERVKDRDDELAKQVPTIEKIIAEAEKAGTDLGPKLADIRSQISKLGPAPDGKDVPPESAEIAAERARLTGLAAEIDGAIKKAELLRLRGRQLIGEVQTLRQDIFTRDLFRRSASPFSSELWVDAAEAIPSSFRQVGSIGGGWLQTAQSKSASLIALGLLAVLLYAFARFICNRMIARAFSQGEAGLPERAYVAGFYGIANAVPSLIGVATIYVGLGELGLLYLQAGQFATAVLKAFVVYKVTVSLARAYLEPGRPEWRLFALADSAVPRVFRIVQALAALFALDMVARELIEVLYLPLPVSVVNMLVSSLGFAVLLSLLLLTPLERPAVAEDDRRLLGLNPDLLKIPLAALLVVIFGAALGGYVALARQLVGQVLVTGAAISLIFIAFAAIRSLNAWVHRDISADAEANGGQPRLKLGLGLTPEVNQRVLQALVLILYIVLSIVAVPLLLLSFNFSPAEIVSLARRGLFGFELFGVQISLFRIFIAICLFSGLLFVTRIIQRGLLSSVLHPSKTDQGLANSIRTGVGYVGSGVAALVGLSYAGLDITNLAIVAGALSVGIGFGLQSIVNNFVSGLILLVERPIKVGDWIQVGTNQGYVRKISVRSTEVETFDRASIIVPNSELISGAVINLTHRNALGRLSIAVGTSYDCDPELVQKVLLKVADESPLVAKHPAALAVFENFGESSLDFTLRVYLADINKGLSTQSQLRTAIWKAFREAGIEIPFPQRDLHLRDLDGFRSALARAVEERAGKQSSGHDIDAGAAGRSSEQAAASGEAPGASKGPGGAFAKG